MTGKTHGGPSRSEKQTDNLILYTNTSVILVLTQWETLHNQDNRNVDGKKRKLSHGCGKRAYKSHIHQLSLNSCVLMFPHCCVCGVVFSIPFKSSFAFCLHSRPKIPRERCGGGALFRNCGERSIPCFRYPYISLQWKMFSRSL